LCSKADVMWALLSFRISCDAFSVLSRFRWIEYQLNALKRCFTPVEIREVLDSLLIGLEATYEQILHVNRKEERKCAITLRALQEYGL
jgi:hypothetical protein